jgi:hypothetical protein
VKRVDLVFRTVNERTSDVALALAERYIQPDRIHILRAIEPFSETVRQMLTIEHDCDVVVYLDADILLLQPLRPFIEFSSAPFVDAVVKDRFRGRTRAGLHIVRRDLVAAMAETPAASDVAGLLRPESSRRNAAMRRLGFADQRKYVHALHDYEQHPSDLFRKLAQRELRSRTPEQAQHLDRCAASWGDMGDFDVARRALAHARAHVPADASKEHIDAYLSALPAAAAQQSAGALDRPFTLVEAEALGREARDRFDIAKPRVFGIGLSRTGTHSLTTALEILGYEVVHYPVDPITLAELQRGKRNLSLLEHYDGITDITAASLMPELRRTFIGARFILTVRETGSWLKSMRQHWGSKKPLPDTADGRVHHQLRTLLRDRVYGIQHFEAATLRRAYARHVSAVRRQFWLRPSELLIMDIVGGDGWEPLCRFLDEPIPDVPFPHQARAKPPRAAWRRRQKIRLAYRDYVRRARRKVSRLLAR